MNSSEECFDRSHTPIPLKLAGRVKRVHSASLGEGLPVREGITFIRNVVSNWYRRSPMPGVVQE